MGWLRKAVKKVAKSAARVTKKGVGKAIANTLLPGLGAQIRAAGNIADKGMGALTIGQISGSDRAKEKARQEEAAANAIGIDPNPAGIVDEEPIDMPTINSAAVEEERKRALLRARARGGRASTILNDKAY